MKNIKKTTKNEILRLAQQTIKKYVKTGKKLECPKNLSEDFQKRAGVFVSIHNKNGELRGCIGTFLPTQKNLAEEIIENAIAACSRDPRFSPISEKELPHLEISVDILSKPKQIKNLNELDAKKYGIIVKSADGRTGLLLPDLEGVNTPEQQIFIACQKAGILPNEPISVYKFRVKRYKE